MTLSQLINYIHRGGIVDGAVSFMISHISDELPQYLIGALPVIKPSGWAKKPPKHCHSLGKFEALMPMKSSRAPICTHRLCHIHWKFKPTRLL